MAEELSLVTGSKSEKYQHLIPQLSALLSGEKDLVANLANATAVLKETFGFFWVGFYLVKGNLSGESTMETEVSVISDAPQLSRCIWLELCLQL